MILLFSIALAAESVRGIVSAVPFVLQAPYRSDWSAEHPEVRAGVVLVLDVAPELLGVRDFAQPVLYVGAAPAEVLRRNADAGRITVVVPGPVGPEVAIYFGGASLPEAVTAAEGARELAAALASGVVPLKVPQSAAAVTVADHAGLLGL